MKAGELTKEQIEEMSDEEINLWYNTMQRQAQVNQMRKELLDIVEIREASEPRVIKIDSKVIE